MSGLGNKSPGRIKQSTEGFGMAKSCEIADKTQCEHTEKTEKAFQEAMHLGSARL